ncbi:MAG: hypothetical protein RR352_04870, partial [Clostridia bacterium]
MCISVGKECDISQLTSRDDNDIAPFNYRYNTTGWKDQLSSYDGKSFSYDGNGNPTQYKDKYYMEWSGRELKGVMSK